MAEAKKNSECGRSNEQCSPARIVSDKENLKSPGNQGRVYGEGWSMFYPRPRQRACQDPLTRQGGDALTTPPLTIFLGFARECACRVFHDFFFSRFHFIIGLT